MSRTLYECPEVGCWYRLALEEFESNEHKCPHGGDTHYGLSVTMSLVSQCWEDLDELMDQIMSSSGKAVNPGLGESIWRSTDDHIKHERLRGQARGMSVLLARFMVPFFSTPDDIAKEAKRRYDARQRGEVYETPGLGSRKFEFPSDDKYKGITEGSLLDSRKASPARKRSLARASVSPDAGLPFGKLTEKEREAILRVKDLMTEDELASIYNTNTGMIRKIWGKEN
jgi:hypothetical protein